jgi:dTDP-4-dehydrorhamnose reductase
LTALFSDEQPDILVHCGGVCDVAKCERDPDWARELNCRSIERLLRILPASTRLVYCSSDHVFSHAVHPLTEASGTDPISVYGRTRVEAEQLVLSAREDALVLRSSLAIGGSFDGKTGHSDWLTYRARNGLDMTIVHDEYRSAVWVDDLAERVAQLAHSTITGLRHIPATRAVSREELAHYLAGTLGLQASFATESRAERDHPHPGRNEQGTVLDDQHAHPQPSVLDRPPERG